MIIEERFWIDSPRDRVVEFLSDIPSVGACVPGVEGLRRVNDAEYEASLVVRIGPITTRFSGSVQIDDSQAPDTILATASGRDGNTGSVAQISFSAHLVEIQKGTTEVRSTSDVSIRGRLGQFGTGVVTGAARTVVREFAICANAAIGSKGTPVAGASSESPSLALVVVRGFLAWARRAWMSAWDRLPGPRTRAGRDD